MGAGMAGTVGLGIARPQEVPTMPGSASDRPKSARRRARKAQGRGRATTQRLMGLGVLAVLVLIWQGVVSASGISPSVLPAPTLVASTIGDNASVLLHNAGYTVEEGLIGFVLAILCGIPLGLLLSLRSRFTGALQYLVTMTQVVPKIAMAPLLLLWMGFGEGPKILMAFLLTFFPITINTFTGIRSVPSEMHELGSLCRMSRLERFWLIDFRHALPQIMGGIKIATTLVVIGALVQEFLAGNTGLGYLLVAANGNLNTPMMFATAVVVTVIGFIFYGLANIAEKYIIPWHVSQRQE